MVRLSDLHEVEAEHMRHVANGMRPVDPAPWIKPKPLAESKIAIISTAGLHRRTDARFTVGAVDYRLLPGDIDFSDVVMSHVSTNFDRSAFQRDPNIWFPLDRLREMANDGEIGGVSRWHYSFMGAQPNHQALKDAGEEVGRLLANDEVDVALLVPV
ncbi:MAG: selenoprotein B glycine/betaine/sarcosine/D-proline reductase [Pseudomonadales bacterium]|nr:selenoprotein B glycine/betaine/sarcosine/D-proline reductase [Pseudomonadales bacterium]